MPPYVGQWLDLLEVPEGRRRIVERQDQTFSVDRLLLTTVPGRNRRAPELAVQRIRRAVQHPSTGSTGRKLLIHGRKSVAVCSSTRPRSWTS